MTRRLDFPSLPLPIKPPFAPMEAKTVDRLPTGPWQYEPKWDGFRCLEFRWRNTVVLQSKNLRPLNDAFPEIVSACLTLPPQAFVLEAD